MASPSRENPQKNHSFREFGGVNTQAARQVINDGEFYWLENVMPIGNGNLRAVPAPSSALVNLPGETCYYMASGSISNVSYMYMFCASGAAYQVNLATNAVTTVAAAGTFSASGARIAQWKNERILIIDPAKGYKDWNGTTLTALSATNGTCIATYSGRVWIANARSVVFSAPGSYTDFTTPSYGGSFILTDETMHSNIVQIFPANNYLYIFGIDAINVLSDVRVNTTLAATVFSNANISAGTGTDLPDAISTYYRTPIFASDYGIFALSGVTPQKISSNLDGVYPNVDLTQAISCGTAVIYNILCLCFLLKYNDPTTGTARQILAVLFGEKWFFSSQVSGMKFIASSLSADVPSLYATDGANLYKLFSSASINISQTTKTKLWDMGDPLMVKRVMKLGMELSISNTGSVSTSIDTENPSSSVVTPINLSNTILWVNNSGVQISWANNLGNPIVWSAGGYFFFRSDAIAYGNYLGLTITSTIPGMIYQGLHLQYENRTPWAGSPFSI
jgi:hypothetical protein